MRVKLQRVEQTPEETLGLFYINGVEYNYTLEDQHRDVKVKGDTRIPAGTYKLALRKFGGHHDSYAKKFPTIHKGMIEIMDVPGFSDILIHIGNTDADTEGCVLTGKSYRRTGARITLVESTAAYLKMYPVIANAIEAEEETTIEVCDEN